MTRRERQDQAKGGRDPDELGAPPGQGAAPDATPSGAERKAPDAGTIPAAARDFGALAAGIAVWALVLRIPWMANILRGSSFLLYPLVPLVVLLSGLVSMIAVNYRFLAAELAWVIGLVLAIGLPPGATGPELTLAVRALLYTGAWFGLIYAPLILLGIWLVDRLRGLDA